MGMVPFYLSNTIPFTTLSSSQQDIEFLSYSYRTRLFLGQSIWGYVSDKIGYKKSLLLGTFCLVLLTLLLFIFQHHFWISLILFFCWQFMGWFIGLQLNTGISIRPQNKSSFILSLNSSNIQPGQAIGLSIAVLVIKAFGIQSLTLLTLSSALLVLMSASLLKERN